REDALAIIERQREMIRGQLAMFRQVYEGAMAGRERAPSPEAFFYSMLTLEYVLSLGPAYLRWLDLAADRIGRGDYTPAGLADLLSGGQL
uniref:hypothetical protein n=1 Tax=Promineifilum sp. TaxID=2664178 RepID=UPI0035B16E9F